MKPIISTTRLSACGIVAATVLSSATLAVEPDVEAILKCKSLQDDAARLACYDSLESQAEMQPTPAAPQTPEPPAPVAAEQSPAQASAPAAPAPVLDDDIGRERLGQKDGKQLTVRGEVVSCREDLNSKYVFTFANGQVWRQKDNRRVPWSECSFEVTIRKDFFGYSLQPDGETKKIRVARVK